MEPLLPGSESFIDPTVYESPLVSEQKQQFIRLLHSARALQQNDATHESAYYRLLHLFVLNGSRLHLLKAIDRRIRGLVDGQKALLLITGESGIGKTSLVNAFRDRIDQLGANFLTARCTEHGQGAHEVWHNLARAAQADRFAIDDLPSPLGSGQKAESPQQLRQALAAWLHENTSEKPLVLLLDDLHWADRASLEILDDLTTQPLPSQVLFIATFRSEEADFEHAVYQYLPRLQRNRLVDTLHLGPLTQEDVQDFIIAYHGTHSPELAAYLHKHAEGHPLFTIALFDSLREQGALREDADGRLLLPAESVSVPAYLKQIITGRIGRLGPDVEKLLSTASVAGESFSLPVIEPLVDLSETDFLHAVEQASQANLITLEDHAAETYAFSHGLIRQVLYESQIPRHRKRLHQQIAAWLDQQPRTSPFILARHYFEAQDWPLAAARCFAAGQLAVQQFASHSALDWFEKALLAAERAGNALDSSFFFEIFTELGQTQMALSRRSASVETFLRMREAAQAKNDREAEGNALIGLSYSYSRLSDAQRAHNAAQEALQVAEKTGSATLILFAKAALANILLGEGQLEQAAHYHDEILNHNEILNQVGTKDYTGTIAFTLRLKAYHETWIGHYKQAEKRARQALELAQAQNDPLAIAGAYNNIAFALVEQGTYPEAYRIIQTTLGSIEEAGSHHQQEPRLLNMMGYLFLEIGDPGEAITWDRKALASVRDIHPQNHEMRRYSLLNQATDYLHLGQPREALEAVARYEAIKEAEDFVRFRHYNRYLLFMSEFHLRQGDIDEAVRWAIEAREMADSRGISKNIAKSHWFEAQALAARGRPDEALDHLETAVAIVDDIRHGSLRWKIRLTQAAMLREAGKSFEQPAAQARELVDAQIRSLTGSPLLDRFLASTWMDSLKALESPQVVPAPGHTSPGAGDTPTRQVYPAGLTRREVEVLRLVARGASDQQVADTLHISVRTVNTHMTNIFNKTGLDNRTAATAFAFEQGLLD